MNKQFLSLLLLVSFASTIVNATVPASVKPDLALEQFNKALADAQEVTQGPKTALQQVMANTQDQMSIKNVVDTKGTILGDLKNVLREDALRVHQHVTGGRPLNPEYASAGKKVSNWIEDAKRAFLGQNSLAEEAEEAAEKAAKEAAVVAEEAAKKAAEAAKKAAFRHNVAKYSTSAVAGLGAGYATYKALNYFDYTNKNLGTKSKVAFASIAGVGSSAGMYFGFDKYVAPAATYVANKTVVLGQQAGSSVYNKVVAHPTIAKVSLGLGALAALGYGLYKLGSFYYAMGNQPQLQPIKPPMTVEQMQQRVAHIEACIENSVRCANTKYTREYRDNQPKFDAELFGLKKALSSSVRR